MKSIKISNEHHKKMKTIAVDRGIQLQDVTKEVIEKGLEALSHGIG